MKHRTIALLVLTVLTTLICAPVAWGAKPAAPTATISANPNTITEGQATQLTWSTTNAGSVTLNGLTVAASGQSTVTPNATTTYTLVAMNPHGSATANVVVTVNVPVPVIQSISPNSAPWDKAVGFQTIITGSGFLSESTATFGSNYEGQVTWLGGNPTQIASNYVNFNNLLGSVDVTVANGNSSGTMTQGFTYTVDVNVTPSSRVNSSPGGQVQFSAEVTTPTGLAADQTGVWSANGGTIDQTGLFTVPADAPIGTVYFIFMTSNATPVGKGTGAVCVAPCIQ